MKICFIFWYKNSSLPPAAYDSFLCANYHAASDLYMGSGFLVLQATVKSQPALSTLFC